MAIRTLEDRVTALENIVTNLQELPGEFAAFRRVVDARFENINVRFDRIDARFEAIDARFEAIDARFEAIDARFEAIDARFETVEARFDKLERGMSDEFEHLYARMRLLHEELIDRIRIGGEGRAGEPPRRKRGPKR